MFRRNLCPHFTVQSHAKLTKAQPFGVLPPCPFFLPTPALTLGHVGFLFSQVPQILSVV